MNIDYHSIALTTQQQLQLAMLSQWTGQNPDELLDQLLAQCLARTSKTNGNGNAPTLYEVFVADGSVGMVHGGPTDMSTNPKYLEGFGQSGN